MHRFAQRLAAVGLLCLSQGCGIILLSEDQEIAMGLSAYPEATAQFEEIKSGSDYRMLQRVMNRLVPFANPDVKRTFQQPFEWEVKLLDAPQTVNAWCLPGGKMAFYTGILPICANEDGVAVVMSHEIAHAVKRHGNQRISSNMILKGLLTGTALVLDEANPESDSNHAILGALAVGGKFLHQLPYSRSHESEADAYGLELLVQAGYDPQEAVRLWERMAAKSGGQRGPEFFSTHPDPLNRAKALAEMIPKVKAKYGK